MRSFPGRCRDQDGARPAAFCHTVEPADVAAVVDEAAAVDEVSDEAEADAVAVAADVAAADRAPAYVYTDAVEDEP